MKKLKVRHVNTPCLSPEEKRALQREIAETTPGFYRRLKELDDRSAEDAKDEKETKKRA